MIQNLCYNQNTKRITIVCKILGRGKNKPLFFACIYSLPELIKIDPFSAWAVNHGIQRTREAASVLSIPARIFPIYFPIGNMATGSFVVLSLLAGVVGFTTSLTGIHNVFIWNLSNLHTAAFSSLASLSLTILAMGLACKEFQDGWTGSNLRTLEVTTVIVSATQLFSTFAIQAGVGNVSAQERGRLGGRV